MPHRLGRKRTREGQPPQRTTDLDALLARTAERLQALLFQWGENRIRLRVAPEATDPDLVACAQRAAAKQTLLVTREGSNGRHTARWDDNRIWDPVD